MQRCRKLVDPSFEVCRCVASTEPRGSKYPQTRVFGRKFHTYIGIQSLVPSYLSTWTLCRTEQFEKELSGGKRMGYLRCWFHAGSMEVYLVGT